MERTIIICNTSSMPVASREHRSTAVTTPSTTADGPDILLLADSTSRAQAMRDERSWRRFPVRRSRLPESRIAEFYERAGSPLGWEDRIGHHRRDGEPRG